MTVWLRKASPSGSDRDAHALVNLLNPENYLVILTHLNRSRARYLKDAPQKKFEIFKTLLENHGFQYKEVMSKGVDIEGGCGQMKANYGR